MGSEALYMFPLIVPGGNPVGEYVLLPISPVTFDAPRLSNAPVPVNNAKLEVESKLGAV
jgi:hypothetical protein